MSGPGSPGEKKDEAAKQIKTRSPAIQIEGERGGTELVTQPFLEAPRFPNYGKALPFCLPFVVKKRRCVCGGGTRSLHETMSYFALWDYVNCEHHPWQKKEKDAQTFAQTRFSLWQPLVTPPGTGTGAKPETHTHTPLRLVASKMALGARRGPPIPPSQEPPGMLSTESSQVGTPFNRHASGRENAGSW